MRCVTVTSPDRVAALVEELDRYPQDRAEIVFEIVAELDRAGDQDSALRWLGTLVEAGRVDGALARVEIAGLHFAAGCRELAQAELAALRACRIGDPAPYAMAAELLAEQGEQSSALMWFTMAATRFSDDQLAAAAG